MSLLDNIKDSISDAAGRVVEGSQQLSEQARLQVSLRKLQLERARKLHDLGARTFDWYRSGSLTVSGPVPSEIAELCAQIDTLKADMDSTQLQLDEARRQAEERRGSFGSPAPDTSSTPAPPNPPTTASVPPPAVPPATPPTRQTSPLPDYPGTDYPRTDGGQ